MTITAGSIVKHQGAPEWGSGKVVEISASRVTIDFSDGISRKIAVSHFGTLQPADRDSYLPPPKAESVLIKPRRVTRVAKKK
ncbi:hypothetical protein OR1_01610 [Geobacter sp. OR-1]|uniref:DUF3553 domain-containing protein n=1 Tax=Geobacter sp. OR-1 TaxID=1266765 RepID=UPI000543CDF0|nr:DUF3553 domain-containing protein [Geobacter sp. OR-1]GAM09335.1 hypothetical protein OR1_01610 [Geobacter sp. OR-1]